VLVVLGGALVILGSWGGGLSWPGRLPGDIHVQRESWSFYLPLGTSIVLSVIVSLVLSFLLRR
jgi:hypothetical protein